MSELKKDLIEIKDYLDNARIYYKDFGSDKIHIITPMTYGFKKKKVFDLEYPLRHYFDVKDNISYIHFCKCLEDDISYKTVYIRTLNSNTEVIITMYDKENYNFSVNAKDVTIRREKDVIINGHQKRKVKNLVFK